MANEKRRELIDRNAFFGIFDQNACKNLGDYGLGVLDVLMDLSKNPPWMPWKWCGARIASMG